MKYAAAPCSISSRTNLRAASDWDKHLQSWKKADKPALEHLPPGAVFQDAPFAPEMVVVPPGRFWMGSKDGEGDADEHPQHEVTIPQAFAVGRFAVTFEEWDAARAANGVKYGPNDEGWGRELRPVVNVSWDDAQAYVQWLSSKTGKPYRLLSEAEWEYACRAGTISAYSFGESISEEQANAGGFQAGPRLQLTTFDAGLFPANDFGVHDMHGNVWEWCEDCWHESYTDKPQILMKTGGAWMESRDREQDGIIPPLGYGSSRFRILRGGSWASDMRDLRAASRDRYSSVIRVSFIGFRVARTILTP